VSAEPIGYVLIEPRWSPDGAKLLWQDVRDAAGTTIFIADMSGAAAGPALPLHDLSLSPEPNAIRMPNYGWAPDSSAVAFMAAPSSGIDQLYLVDVTALPPGPALRVHPAELVVPESIFFDHFPWSADSTHLLYRAYLDFRYELWAVDTVAAPPWTAVRVNGTLVLGGEVEAAQPESFAWAPWGHVVYRADQTTNDRVELWWSNLAGLTRRVNGTLTPYGDVVEFRFPP
jgi:hypothetical protein